MLNKKKLRIAFALFLLLVASTVSGGVVYLQSASFATTLKVTLKKYFPKNLGIEGDFENLKLYMFPPGVGVGNLKVTLEENNIASLPLKGTIQANEAKIEFEPLQMLSGTLKVRNAIVRNGNVQVHLSDQIFQAAKKQPKAPLKLNWRDLLQIKIEGVTLENVTLKAQLGSQWGNAEASVQSLTLFKETVVDRPILTSVAQLKQLKFDFSKLGMAYLPQEVQLMSWDCIASPSGILLKPIQFSLPGLQAQLRGEIKGNFLEETSPLEISAQYEASSQLGSFLSWVKQLKELQGQAQLKGTLHGNLKDIEHTLEAQFEVAGKDLLYEKASAQQLESTGRLDLKNRIIEIKHLKAYSPTQGRLAGGELELEPTQIPLDFKTATRAKLYFKNADFHWLGGIILPKVFLLDGKVFGTLGVHYEPEFKKAPSLHPWKVTLHPEIRVSKFALTNQKYDIKRKHLNILKPTADIHVAGPVEISHEGVRFQRVSVSAAETRLQVTGGVQRNGELFILGQGPIALQELNEIAENPIRGRGEVRVDVHGPSENFVIDVDAQLKSTEYLGLKFGDLTGRVTYDDERSELRFENIKVQQNKTYYSLKQGRIDLGAAEDLQLPIQIQKGSLQDLAYILEKFVRKVSWYPNELEGEIHGDITVGGYLDTERLTVSSHIEGADWTWLGERFKKIKMNAGFSGQNYFAKNVEATKTNGKIFGQVEFDLAKDFLKWKVSTQGLSLYDFDWIERLEVPAKSKIKLTSSGEGILHQLKSDTQVTVYDTVIKGQKYEPSSLSLVVGDKTLNLKINGFGQQCVSQFKYALTPKQPSQFDLKLNQFDFSPLLLVLNPRLVDDPRLQALAQAEVSVEFLSTQSELARGSIQIDQLSLVKTNFKAQLDKKIILPIQFGYFKILPTEIVFNKSKLKFWGEANRGELNIQMDGGVDLALGEVLSSSVLSASGVAPLSLKLLGSIQNPKWVGDLKFEGGSFLLRFLQTPFEELSGKMILKDDFIELSGISAYLADEMVTGSGTIELFSNRFPKLNLQAHLKNNKIKMQPFDLLQVAGLINIEGDAPPYKIGGSVEVPLAYYFKPFSSTGTNNVRGDRFAPKVTNEQIHGGNWFQLDLQAKAPKGFIIKNEILDAEFKGNVKLLGSPQDPKLLGEASLVSGKILFRDRPFIFDSVNVEFDDPSQFNPKFSASAVSEISQYKLRLLASGRLSDWKVEFHSTPFLSENDIYSLLSSGQTTAEGGRFRVRDRTMVNQGEAASLILHSLEVSKDMQSKTGFQFDVEEAVDQQSAASIFKPQTLTENVAAPKLVIKRKVGRKFDLSFGSTVGVGSQVVREVNAEYKVTPSTSVQGVWNAIEGVNTRESRTSYGVDIKVNKKFK